MLNSYELLVVAFHDIHTAGDTLARMKSFQQAQLLHIVNAAVLVKKTDGTTTMHETEDVYAREGAIFGVITGALIGLLGGPVGAVAGALAGATTGGISAHLMDMGFSNKELKLLQNMLTPGSSAIVALIEHTWIEHFIETLQEVATDAEAYQMHVHISERIADSLQHKGNT